MTHLDHPDETDESIDVADLDMDAAARGELYRLLARAFEHPDEEFHADLQSGAFAEACRDLLARTSLDVSLPDLSVTEDYEALAARYNDLFVVGFAEYEDRTDGTLASTGPPVPLYEIEYRSDTQWGDVNIDLARAYDYYGVSVDESERDNHDNLRLELSFAGYLARRAALNPEEGAAGARLDFLDRHLGVLADGVADALDEEHDTDVYGALGSFLAAFVAADAADLGTRREQGEIP
ncbi:molecular chaperone TorD family protein [Halarchaeum sp. P4]|uniref:molecular chaperone TorD family protein n=1 Tax=Halarchaeum sp. P4 TaxID=3421639 RepID=UPI003EBBE5A6